MKSLTLLTILTFALVSCQPTKEEKQETSPLEGMESPVGANASLPHLIKGGDRPDSISLFIDFMNFFHICYFALRPY